MNDELKQSIIDLLEAAKAHIGTGEYSDAAEKIDAAIAEIENEGVEAANEDEPKDPPLPGQGTNGGRT